MKLAADKSWDRISMRDIAEKAKLDLADISKDVSCKADILTLLARSVDEAMLKSLADDPVEGDPHDRLFEVIMRRLEAMGEYDKQALANIIDNPVNNPADAIRLMFTAHDSINWMLTAAQIDDSGKPDMPKRAGLALVMARTVRVWLHDDDEGLSTTMASLDKSLRDGAKWLRRIEGPLALAGAFRGLARGICKSAINGRGMSKTRQQKATT